MTRSIGLVIALLLFFSSNANAAMVELLHPPLAEQTSLSRLTTDAKGTLHLSWVQSSGKLSALYHASLKDGQWTDAKLISEGDDWFVNWADFPFLAVNENAMAAHWLKKSSGGTYDYDVVATFYSSKTEHWTPPVIIHKDGVSAEHGFVSMLPLNDERTFITWLDGRNTRQDPAHAQPDAPAHPPSHSEGHAAGGMTLRAGIFNTKGETIDEWELDDLVCDCCQTSSAMTTAGPVVVYRNRTTDEIRDTYITRMVDGAWSRPVAVHHDNWKIAGCPVNGPSIASRDGLTAVAWFTAKDDMPKVSIAWSQDNGQTFSDPVVVTKGNTSGRLSLTILESGDTALSWLENDGAAARVKLSRYDSNGKLKDTLTIADTQSSRRSGFPVITNDGNDVYVTWTDIFAEPLVKVARVRF